MNYSLDLCYICGQPFAATNHEYCRAIERHAKDIESKAVTAADVRRIIREELKAHGLRYDPSSHGAT